MPRSQRSLTLTSVASSKWSSHSVTAKLIKTPEASVIELSPAQSRLKPHPASLRPASKGPISLEGTRGVGPLTRQIALNPIGTFIALNTPFSSSLRWVKQTFKPRKVELRRQTRLSASVKAKDRAPMERLWLEDLGPEYLQHIATFLPTIGVATLALSSRIILSKLGTECLEQIPKRRWPDISLKAVQAGCIGPAISKDQKDRQLFLTILGQDLLYDLYCHHCQIIHGPEYHKHCSISQEAISAEGCPTSRKNGHVALDFPLIQLLMKRHSNGYNVDRRLRTLEEPFNSTRYTEAFTEQRWASAKIVQGQLYMRFQLFVLSKCKEGKKARYLRYNVCLHCQTPTNREDPLTSPMTGSCHRCFTDFRLSKESFDNGSEVLSVTVWKNFGEGRNPFELKWLSHHFETYAYFLDSYQSLNSERSPYKMFEGKDKIEDFKLHETHHIKAKAKLFRPGVRATCRSKFPHTCLCDEIELTIYS